MQSRIIFEADKMNYRTYAAIDLDAVEFNYKNIREKIPANVKMLGVIKADAYGHGAVEIAKFLEDKYDFFGVACIEEANELVSANISTPILILGTVFPWNYEAVVENNIRIPVYTFEEAKALSDEAVKKNKTVPFHFCLDTGMSRIGFQATDESIELCKKIVKLPNIYAEGIFSHFATADEADLSKANKQKEIFKNFCNSLEKEGIDLPIKHISNSAGIINFDEYFDMCRVGIIQYGLYPSDDVDKSIIKIKPTMSWHTKISFIKTLEKGREISYGGTYTTEKETKVATIPVGYADGYPRCLSNKGKVIINGKYANIIGRVCMDQLMVDVTDINCEIGDDVVLIGKQGNAELTMEEVGNSAYSFNYELSCRISRRIPRAYFINNVPIKIVDYLTNY